MHLEKLRLYHFRNHRDSVFSFSSGTNVLWGPNGSGKTSVAEAVHALATGRSHRTSDFRDVLAWGAEESSLHGSVQDERGAFRLKLVLQGGRKEHSWNDQPLEAKKLWGKLPLIFFAPDSIRIVSDDPSYRRRFLNGVLQQADPAFAETLERYKQVLAERNASLKAIRNGSLRPGHESVWDEALADLALVITEKRRALCEVLNGPAERYYREIEGSRTLRLCYEPSVPEAVSAVGREALLKEWASRRAVEVALGMTMVGPHRDDLEILLDGRPARSFSSQGQARAVVLSMKLAAQDALLDQTGIAPVTVFDDVFSELDARRKESFWALLHDRSQSFLTMLKPEPWLKKIGATIALQAEASSEILTR